MLKIEDLKVDTKYWVHESAEEYSDKDIPNGWHPTGEHYPLEILTRVTKEYQSDPEYTGWAHYMQNITGTTLPEYYWKYASGWIRVGVSPFHACYAILSNTGDVAIDCI